jgi:putative SOS response-associated peptidase YedK
MPVILRGRAVDAWLDPAVSDPALLEPLFAPLPSADLKATAVSPRVNSVRNEGPECIAPAPPLTAEEPPPPQLSLGLE